MTVSQRTIQPCDVFEEAIWRLLIFDGSRLWRSTEEDHLMARTHEQRAVRQPDRITNRMR